MSIESLLAGCQHLSAGAAQGEVWTGRGRLLEAPRAPSLARRGAPD